MSVRRFVLTSLCIATTACGTATASAPSTTTTTKPIVSHALTTDGMGFEPALTNHYNGQILILMATIEANRREAEAAAERERANRVTPRRSSVVITGTCAEMKPAGFPDYIIYRESRGDPNVVNKYGYTGCAQLDSDYLTGDYAADWARLWDNGKGACHWNPPNYCGG